MGLVEGFARAAVTRHEMRRSMRSTLGADSLGGILDQFKQRARSPLELERLAGALGLEYSRWERLGLIDDTLPIYREGMRREIESVVHGLVGGVPLALFDYECGVGGGAERHFTCAQIGLAAPVPAPAFSLEDGSVECDDPAFVPALLDAGTQAWIDAGPEHLVYQTGGHWALVAAQPLLLDKWENLARTAIVWGSLVAAVLGRRTRVV